MVSLLPEITLNPNSLPNIIEWDNLETNNGSASNQRDKKYTNLYRLWETVLKVYCWKKVLSEGNWTPY